MVDYPTYCHKTKKIMESQNDLLYQVGEYVVYPSHGVGKICDIDEQKIGGTCFSVYIIEFLCKDMVISLPVSSVVKSGLRSLNKPSIVDRVMKIVSGKPSVKKGIWSKKVQQYEAIINSGKLLNIAKVLRNLGNNVKDPNRSYSERLLYETALERVASEIAVITGRTFEALKIEINEIIVLNYNERMSLQDEEESDKITIHE